MKTYKAKKSLGQNFLKSEPALRKIVEAGEVGREDMILEIGPGKGALTKKLLEYAGRVIAVEKDEDLFEFLQIKFEQEIKDEKLILLNEDILELDVNSGVLKNQNYKIIANIPYNITGAILKKFLTAEHQPERMVLMVQHEVGKRIVARDAKESILSISVKAYGEPKLVMKVPARYFSPAPNVDSAVITINNISKKAFIPNTKPVKSSALNILDSEGLEERFWKIVKMGFAHKRKKLSGNLKSLNFEHEETYISIKDKRAEDLPLEMWISLAKI